MVLYLNDDLTATDYGETTFYVSRPDDGVHKFMGRGGEMYEAIGSVAPKFGRVAIFTSKLFYFSDFLCLFLKKFIDILL